MTSQFVASQSVEITVLEQPVPIQHYLRQPQRLVYAIADPSLIKQLSRDCFRLKMRPLHFLSVSFQPIVDLQIEVDAQSTVHLTSVGCQIKGLDYINQRFALKLKGILYPIHHQGVTLLKGKADLQVKVDVPFPFSLTPAPVLETTGNGLLKSVLVRIKGKLMHQLLLDYRQWANRAHSEEPTSIGTQGKKFVPVDHPIV